MRYGLTEPDNDKAPGHDIFPVQSSVLDEAALCRQVLPSYRLADIRSCRFFSRGDADIYRVDAAGRQFYLKVYRPPREVANVEAEARYVSDLASIGVQVVLPVSRKDGSYSIAVEAPEGQRPMLLFEEAPPTRIEAIDKQLLNAMGAAVARLHQATDSLSSTYDLPTLDFASVAGKTLPYSEQYLSPVDFSFLLETASRLAGLLADYRKESPDYGLCHADLVLSNLRMQPKETITFFDFGNASYTWRILDLVVVQLSAARASGQDSAEVLGPLSEGYAAIQTLPDNFDRMLNLMQILRWLSWIGGNSASLPLRRGIEPFERDLLKQPVRFIRDTLQRIAG